MKDKRNFRVRKSGRRDIEGVMHGCADLMRIVAVKQGADFGSDIPSGCARKKDFCHMYTSVSGSSSVILYNIIQDIFGFVYVFVKDCLGKIAVWRNTTLR